MCNSVSLKMVDLDHMILTIQNHTRKNGAVLGVYSVISGAPDVGIGIGEMDL